LGYFACVIHLWIYGQYSTDLIILSLWKKVLFSFNLTTNSFEITVKARFVSIDSKTLTFPFSHPLYPPIGELTDKRLLNQQMGEGKAFTSLPP
jgi:hypothetical protein